MYGGQFIGFIFFLVLFIAAITTLIALLEPIIRGCEKKGQDRRIITPILIVTIWLLVWILFLSTGAGFADEIFKSKTLLELLQYLSQTILLPLNTFLICVFIGYFAVVDRLRQALSAELEIWFKWWYLLVRSASIIAIYIYILYSVKWLL